MDPIRKKEPIEMFAITRQCCFTWKEAKRILELALSESQRGGARSPEGEEEDVETNYQGRLLNALQLLRGRGKEKCILALGYVTDTRALAEVIAEN